MTEEFNLTEQERIFVFNAIEVFIHDNTRIMGRDNVQLGRTILAKIKRSVPALQDAPS